MLADSTECNQNNNAVRNKVLYVFDYILLNSNEQDGQVQSKIFCQVKIENRKSKNSWQNIIIFKSLIQICTLNDCKVKLLY